MHGPCSCKQNLLLKSHFSRIKRDTIYRIKVAWTKNWNVALKALLQGATDWKNICAASVLSKNVLLTAAHCFKNRNFQKSKLTYVEDIEY